MKKTLIKEIEITADKVVLKGNLSIPKNAKAIILFAHGSGSSRFSPRNQYVAQVLYKAGLATLLMDLLTKEEELIDEQTGELRFNIEFLADRLIGATTWLKKNSEAKKLAVGYFGSSTGAGAALIAAAKYPADIKTIVSRGGRPDLAMPYLKKVKASVLLIVGGNDIPVIRMNKEAMKQLSIEKKLEIVPGATHLFEEPGKLEEVAKLAAGWFTKHM
ncbi:MAG: dienelactone hydrolase family protein [Candidatus Woesearchaeota archaeon]|nr:dienelactone hydrolase family protein [Candidatus Woesearchaeota archaeon]